MSSFAGGNGRSAAKVMARADAPMVRLRRREIMAGPSSQEKAGFSGQNRLDHVAVDVGQTVIAATVTVGQFLVVQAQQMQNRGVQVMNVDAILDRVPAELV